MAKDTYTHIILWGPLLATSCYTIDGKGGRLTFDVEKCHVEFTLFEDRNPFLSSFAFEEVMVSDEIEMHDVLCHTDPLMFDCVSTKGPDLDYAKVEFIAPMPPSVIENKPYAINEAVSYTHLRAH